MTDQLTDREVFNIKYMINRRALRSEDELDEMVCQLLDQQDAQITALTAEVEALRNPPYRIEVERDSLDTDVEYPNYPDEYQATVMRGDVAIMEFDWCETEQEAREQAQSFLEKLTVPVVPKES